MKGRICKLVDLIFKSQTSVWSLSNIEVGEDASCFCALPLLPAEPHFDPSAQDRKADSHCYLQIPHAHENSSSSQCCRHPTTRDPLCFLPALFIHCPEAKLVRMHACCLVFGLCLYPEKVFWRCEMLLIQNDQTSRLLFTLRHWSNFILQLLTCLVILHVE